MPENIYSVAEYVSEIQSIVSGESDEKKLTQKIMPLAKRLAASGELKKPEYRVCDETQGFGVHLLHEEDNHDLGVFVLSWLPDRGTLPHNHLTWAVVAVMEGEEHEVHWNRSDDGTRKGYAEIEKVKEITMSPGDVSICMSDEIHSVWNNGDEISVSLHTYGRHINFTGRSQFDPNTHTEIPFIVTVED